MPRARKKRSKQQFLEVFACQLPASTLLLLHGEIVHMTTSTVFSTCHWVGPEI